MQTAKPEMEFLDVSLTKDSSLFLHAIQSPFYCRILKKTILYTYSSFDNPYKEIRETIKLKPVLNSSLLNEKLRVENQTNSQVWEDSS